VRSIFAIFLVLLMLGCASHRHEQSYIYTPPVVITFKSLQHTNNYSFAVFTMSNVSSESMWYDGEDKQHPACCLEYKSISYSGHSPGGDGLWGDAGLGRYELTPGQSCEFKVIREKFSEPFRVGVWLGQEINPSEVEDSIYWSAFVNP
jgi:hypothetical protein